MLNKNAIECDSSIEHELGLNHHVGKWSHYVKNLCSWATRPMQSSVLEFGCAQHSQYSLWKVVSHKKNSQLSTLNVGFPFVCLRYAAGSMNVTKWPLTIGCLWYVSCCKDGVDCNRRARVERPYRNVCVYFVNMYCMFSHRSFNLIFKWISIHTLRHDSLCWYWWWLEHPFIAISNKGELVCSRNSIFL